MGEISNHQKQRNSNIELLRILSIIAIICYHIVIHNNWWFVEGTGDWGSIFVPKEFTIGVFTLQSFLPLGITAVNIFVLITGYFLIYSTKIKLEKCLKIYIQMLFYSIILVIAFFIYGGEELHFETIVTMFTPITHNTWWFLSSYLFLLILSPILNIIVANVDEKKLTGLLVFFIIFWFVFPMITDNQYLGNELWWFIVVYLIGGLIRKKTDNYDRKWYFYILFAAFFYLLSVGVIVLFDYYEPNIFTFNHIQAIQYRNSIFTLMIAIFTFLGFKNIEMKENKIINYIASLTLGVYMVHEHYLVVGHIFKLEWVYSCSSVTGILKTLVVLTFAEYLICLIIEAVRKTIFDGFLLKRITNSIDIPIVANNTENK